MKYDNFLERSIALYEEYILTNQYNKCIDTDADYLFFAIQNRGVIRELRLRYY